MTIIKVKSMESESQKLILDACCGSRMMWFDKQNPLAVFMDIRNESVDDGQGRVIHIRPDQVGDFRSIPHPDESFYIVVMDPPHSKWTRPDTIMGKLYGQLLPTWETDIRAGVDECMRVLKPYGTFILKWHDKDIKLSKLLQVIGREPLFGHTGSKHGRTHWLCFMKLPAAEHVSNADGGNSQT